MNISQFSHFLYTRVRFGIANVSSIVVKGMCQGNISAISSYSLHCIDSISNGFSPSPQSVSGNQLVFCVCGPLQYVFICGCLLSFYRTYHIEFYMNSSAAPTGNPSLAPRQSTCFIFRRKTTNILGRSFALSTSTRFPRFAFLIVLCIPFDNTGMDYVGNGPSHMSLFKSNNEFFSRSRNINSKIQFDVTYSVWLNCHRMDNWMNEWHHWLLCINQRTRSEHKSKNSEKRIGQIGGKLNTIELSTCIFVFIKELDK